jgi:cell division septation protein DedD
LEEFIDEVKKEYDVIIFDSSPILSTADAAILGMKVDGVLLVYRVGSISKGLLKRTASQLEQVQCNLMGVIVNGINPDISPDFQGYKYYKYYYSYGEGKNNKSIGDGSRHIKGPLLMYTAIACLSVGFLWQSGLLTSFKRSILGTRQPGPISSKSDIPKNIVKMDMPDSVPTQISKTRFRPEEKTTAKNEQTEQAPLANKPSDKAVALISALLYGKANKANFIKPVVYEERPGYSYTLQLGAYRSLEGAKAAVTTYRGKGISAYWSEVALKGNKRWFRVYTGIFKNPGDARTFKEENNLVESIIKKTPYRASVGSFPGVKPSPILKAPEPVSKESGTNGSGNHEQGGPDPMSELKSPPSNKRVGKPPAELSPPEAPPTEAVSQYVIPRLKGGGSRNPRDDNDLVDSPSTSLGVVNQSNHGSRYATPRSSGMTGFTHYDAVPTTITQEGKTPLEQAPSEHAQPENQNPELAARFSGPSLVKASPSTELRTVSLSNGRSDLEKPVTHEANPKYPFSIQLGAFRTLVEAQNAVSVFREKGISSYWSEVDLEGNEKWFRVYTGYFETREEAITFGEALKFTPSIVKETPHSTLIGSYSDKDKLEAKTLLLNDLGYLPYTIEDQDNKYRLFIGAFITKQGAEAQRKTLESKGIKSQIVKR